VTSDEQLRTETQKVSSCWCASREKKSRDLNAKLSEMNRASVSPSFPVEGTIFHSWMCNGKLNSIIFSWSNEKFHSHLSFPFNKTIAIWSIGLVNQFNSCVSSWWDL
jgi:hypothetical protein